jgi:hypothetical protein
MPLLKGKYIDDIPDYEHNWTMEKLKALRPEELQL